MRIQFRLREKLILITIITIILSLGFNTFFNLLDFIHVYKASISTRVFSEAQELKRMISDVSDLGLSLGELKGLNRECRYITKIIPYAKYCFVMGNDGKSGHIHVVF